MARIIRKRRWVTTENNDGWLSANKTYYNCYTTLLEKFPTSFVLQKPGDFNEASMNLHYFSNNENPTRALNATTLKFDLPSTDAINWRGENSRMRMKVQGSLMQTHYIEIHKVF